MKKEPINSPSLQLVPLEQVLGGLPGRALLRRQRVHRPGFVFFLRFSIRKISFSGDAVPEAGALRVRAGPGALGRQRPAALRLTGQLRRLRRHRGAARPHHGIGGSSKKWI